MDNQTNRSYCNLIDPVLRSYVHERSTVDTLEGNRECLIKASDGPQGAFLPQLDGGLVGITEVFCLVSLCLILKHQRLSNRWNSDLLGLIETFFHGSPSSCWPCLISYASARPALTRVTRVVAFLNHALFLTSHATRPDRPPGRLTASRRCLLV